MAKKNASEKVAAGNDTTKEKVVKLKKEKVVEATPKPVEEKEPEKKTVKNKQFLKYEFSEKEIHDKGVEMARMSSEIKTIQNEAQATAKQFSAQISSKSSEMELLMNHINNGHEHRYVDCTTTHHVPESGMKTTVRNDTGEVVTIQKMTTEEMQTEIAFTVELNG